MNATATYTGATSTLAGIINHESDKTNHIYDSDHDISPVTLSSAWSRVARLLLLASMSVGGSVGNVFMISAVVVEDQLKKRGTKHPNHLLKSNNQASCKKKSIIFT